MHAYLGTERHTISNSISSQLSNHVSFHTSVHTCNSGAYLHCQAQVLSQKTTQSRRVSPILGILAFPIIVSTEMSLLALAEIYQLTTLIQGIPLDSLPKGLGLVILYRVVFSSDFLDILWAFLSFPQKSYGKTLVLDFEGFSELT